LPALLFTGMEAIKMEAAKRKAPMEAELKLLVDKTTLQKLDKLSQLESVTVGQVQPRKLVNVYFDTADAELKRAGLGLRIRHVDDKRLQTMKDAGKVEGGLHQRNEWESDIHDDRPDLSVLREMVGPASPHAKLLATPGLADRLQPVFTVHVTRTISNLRLRTGDEVEMAIDEGMIEKGEAREPISEIELELTSGEPVHLYAFALELLDAMPMRIGKKSKAERGYALLQPDEKIVKATKLKLQPSMTVEHAFEAIVAGCMAQIEGNEQKVIQGSDPESLHQMRVGLRRLRSALDLFRDIIDCPAGLRDGWKWLGGELGAARDWEVLADSTLKEVEDLAAAEVDVAALRRSALEQARMHRGKAADAVMSARHTRLQLQFAEWMASKEWRRARPAQDVSAVDMPLKKFAHQALKHGERRLLKRGRHLKGNDPVSRHRTRIAGKKVRYATEFLASIYARHKVKRYVAALSTLQQELGRLNDAAVAVQLLDSLPMPDHTVAASAGFVRGYLYASIHGDNPRLQKCWKLFASTKPPYAMRH
jgi:triphosphatase